MNDNLPAWTKIADLLVETGIANDVIECENLSTNGGFIGHEHEPAFSSKYSSGNGLPAWTKMGDIFVKAILLDEVLDGDAIES